ncbi:MAG TPA: phospho-N-acetylmuramoyl-pentapeptide-transferase [Vicinamibacteria bacterium]|nr:phospho-N-acetylmuramoyl-pentapeptide-transferase [Vicinamibacteria bacterium]
MIYHLLYPLHEDFSFFNVFRYVTFRTASATLTALAISFVMGPWLIRRLRRFQIGQHVRQEGPETHRSKAGTPTMGGLLILAAMIAPTLLWANLTNVFVWMALGTTVAFGLIGFFDDYLKIVRRHSTGLSPRAKLVLQTGSALVVALLLHDMSRHGDYSTELLFPFFKQLRPNLDWYFVPFAIVVIVGASNAVNLTDGLDGLAIGTVLIAAGAYTVLTYVTGHAQFSSYLDLIHIPRIWELTIFCGAMVGASLGFLWFNSYPAQIFMGDVGSLALGSAIGTVALLIKQELLLVLVGGVFVIEAASVILQVGSFKLTGKRVFRMAPLHHHFELAGWSEPKVIIRFWILGLMFALASLTTLKLR